MSYKVKLNIFEGPLDLLLFLIKKEKIDIYDIPIASVTDQYLEYMNLIKLLDLDIAGEFLVMAATLIHIKSKMLLPQDEVVEEEEERDPREELIERLLEYKKYKDAAEKLKDLKERNKDIFFRQVPPDKTSIIAEDGTEYFQASLFELITAFKGVLKKVQKKSVHRVTKNRFTVEDKIHAVYHIFAKQEKIYFLSLFQQAEDKDEAIVIFLAVLELIKRREVLIAQKGLFEEIEIIRNPELVHSLAYSVSEERNPVSPL
ncbi:MAG: segregation/condensation protein A [Candidatus Omnitrophota bacterium]